MAPGPSAPSECFKAGADGCWGRELGREGGFPSGFFPPQAHALRLAPPLSSTCSLQLALRPSPQMSCTCCTGLCQSPLVGCHAGLRTLRPPTPRLGCSLLPLPYQPLSFSLCSSNIFTFSPAFLCFSFFFIAVWGHSFSPVALFTLLLTPRSYSFF